MSKILVTGAGGFIGSNLVERLVEQGHQVKAFVRYNSRGNWGWLDASFYRKEIEFISGDIRDYDSVLAAAQDCDQIFHLAALIGIPYSYVSPSAYIKTNIEGTYNVLQASLTHEVRNVLITSTSETYGTAQYVPIDEQHPLVGQSPYSASKIAADQLAISYYRSFNAPVKIVRPFNTYGPRQSARAIIPTIISQILSGRVLKLGNLAPTRDLTYVQDTVNGFIEISEHDELNGTVTNIGMNQEISVGDLARKIGKLIGVDVQWEVDLHRFRPEKSEVERLMSNNTRIIKYTNWKPRYSLEQGLVETINWFKENISHYKPEIYNV